MASSSIPGVSEVSLVFKLVGKILKTQVSVFAFGAERVGKTSFVRRLEGYPTVRDIFGASNSYGSVPHSLHVNPDPVHQDLSIRLLFMDMGGEKQYATTRENELKTFRPIGILFFLDHRSSDTEKRDIDNAQTDDGTVDQNRVDRHHDAFKELTEVLATRPEVRSVCNALVIVINKVDEWRKKTTLDFFHKEFNKDIHEVMKVGGIQNVPPLISCSIKTGEGIPEIMRTLFSLSGWELLLPFGKRIRFKAKLLG